jgi:hypothetical protein
MGHPGFMEFIVIAFILLVGPLAVLRGVESRRFDERDRRWFIGAPRP